VAWRQIIEPGCLPDRISCCQSRHSPKSSAASSGKPCKRRPSSHRSPPKSGSRIGWWPVKNTGTTNRWGDGRTALKYLAPYVFRIAISNRCLVKLEDDQVTFRYRATDTGEPKLCTLSAEAFIHRFLQHVLPKGFVKMRYFGFLAPGCRKRLLTLRQRLEQSCHNHMGEPEATPETVNETPEPNLRCSNCGQPMLFQHVIQLTGRCPP
jgi:hypothetical protein